VVKGELGVVHGVLGSMDVVVRVLERALDTVVQYTYLSDESILRKGRLVSCFAETSVIGTSISTLSFDRGNVNYKSVTISESQIWKLTVLGNKLLNEGSQGRVDKVLDDTNPLLGPLLDPSSHVHLQHCQYLSALFLVTLGDSLRT
jgi:hypothetical protein